MRRAAAFLALVGMALAPAAAAGGAGASPEVQATMARFRAEAAAALAADVEARVAAARQLFGARVPVRVVADRFVLVGADPRAPFGPAVDLAERALDVYTRRFFARLPDRAVSVYLTASAARFDDVCARVSPDDCDAEAGLLGLYDRRARAVLVDLGPGLPSLTQELVHPLVQTDFVRAPAWLDEGIASLFEKPVFAPPGELHGAKNWRYDVLARALATPALHGPLRPSLLFDLNDDSFLISDQGAHYALARFVCQWLDERGQLWPFYRAWRDSLAEDPSGEKTFARVTGLTPTQADAVWLAWLRALGK